MTTFAFSLILLLNGLPLHAQKPAEPAPAAAAAESRPAPVLLDGRELFGISSGIMSMTREERAGRIGDRLARIAADASLDHARLAAYDAGTYSEIAIGDYVVMTVTDSDAKASGRPRQALASHLAELMRAALEEHRDTYNLRHFAIGLLLALAVTALVFPAMRLLNRFYQGAEKALAERASERIRGVKLQGVELVPARRITELLSLLLGAARLAVFLLLLYVYLALLFSFFPWTKGLASELLGYVTTPLKAILLSLAAYFPHLVFVAVVVLFVHYALRVLHTISGEVSAGRISFPGFYQDWAEPTFQIVRFAAWAFTLVIVFPYLPGSDSPAFKGVSVFLGVLLSLGSSSAVANGVAGVIITYMRPFKLGDRVKIVDTVGDVVEKSLLVTRVRTVKNVYITVPNALVLGSHIVNYSSSPAGEPLLLSTTVTLGYDTPWRKAHELLIASALEAEGILQEPRPFVLQTALNDCHVSYELNAATSTPERMAQIYSGMHQNIQDKFAAAGIEILSPAYSALRDGSAALPPGAGAHTAAALKVRVEKQA